MAVLALVFFFTCFLFALPGSIEKQLTWEANTEVDLAGYRLYFRAETESYIDDRSATIPAGFETYSLKDTPFNTYMVLTAFDVIGNESGFSNEVIYIPFDQDAPAIPGSVSIEGVK